MRGNKGRRIALDIYLLVGILIRFKFWLIELNYNTVLTVFLRPFAYIHWQKVRIQHLTISVGYFHHI